jgi:hypothetical protein
MLIRVVFADWGWSRYSVDILMISELKASRISRASYIYSESLSRKGLALRSVYV